MCLDCELMPWSVKAQELLMSQYAPLGAVGTQVLSSARTALANRHYCWPVKSIEDLKLAPFHLLATEGSVHTDKQHG
jgi:protein phosphatase